MTPADPLPLHPETLLWSVPLALTPDSMRPTIRPMFLQQSSMYMLQMVVQWTDWVQIPLCTLYLHGRQL